MVTSIKIIIWIFVWTHFINLCGSLVGITDSALLFSLWLTWIFLEIVEKLITLFMFLFLFYVL